MKLITNYVVWIVNALIGHVRAEAVARWRLEHDDPASPEVREELRKTLGKVEYGIPRLIAGIMVLMSPGPLRDHFLECEDDRPNIIEDLLSSVMDLYPEGDAPQIPVRDLLKVARQSKNYSSVNN